MQWLKISTAVSKIVGPILDSTGAEYASAVIGDLSLSKNGGTLTALASAATLTYIANGYYTLALTTGNTDTLGSAEISVNKATYQMPPREFMVLPATVYDALTTNATNATGGLVAATNTVSAVAGYLGASGAAVNGTNVNTLAGHDPGAPLSSLTQTQVTGGAYALNHASFAFNAALDFTTTQKTSLSTTTVAAVAGDVGGDLIGSLPSYDNGAGGLEAELLFIGASHAVVDAAGSTVTFPTVVGTSTLTQPQVTGGAYALNSSSFAFNSAMDFTTTQKAATIARVTLTDTVTNLTNNNPSLNATALQKIAKEDYGIAGTVWHVATTGNDTTGDGLSWVAPYATLDKAIAVASAGDGCVMAPGLYASSGVVFPQYFKLRGSGKNATLIQTFVGADVAFKLAAGVEITDCQLHNDPEGGGASGATVYTVGWVSGDTTATDPGARIERCTISLEGDGTGACVGVSNGSSLRVVDCDFVNGSPGLKVTHASAIVTVDECRLAVPASNAPAVGAYVTNGVVTIVATDFFDGTGSSPTTYDVQRTGGTVTLMDCSYDPTKVSGTVTIINSPIAQTGQIRAGAFQADSITAAALATDAVTEIAAGVWQDTTAGHFTTAGSIGKSLAPATLGTTPGAATGHAIVGSAMAIGTDGLSAAAVSAAGAAKVADVMFRRTMAHVETSSDGDTLSLGSLYGLVQMIQKSNTTAHANKLTTYKIDGVTELGQKDLTTDPDAEPTTGIS